ncbi:MAG: hypothetical protein OXF02_01990 [Simkaniaceae bacterium]|nr:hypothetical protein [Simkaniaceae bacterium]
MRCKGNGGCGTPTEGFENEACVRDADLLRLLLTEGVAGCVCDNHGIGKGSEGS